MGSSTLPTLQTTEDLGETFVRDWGYNLSPDHGIPSKMGYSLEIFFLLRKTRSLTLLCCAAQTHTKQNGKGRKHWTEGCDHVRICFKLLAWLLIISVTAHFTNISSIVLSHIQCSHKSNSLQKEGVGQREFWVFKMLRSSALCIQLKGKVTRVRLCLR